MTSTELVPTGANVVGRRAELARLSAAVDAAATVEETQNVKIYAETLRDALVRMKAPFDECWSAGKDSVCAARKLGRMLEDLPAHGPGSRAPGQISPRYQAMSEVGISRGLGSDLRRLARCPDPDFQRYIQSRDRVPSIGGALRACGKVSSPGGLAWNSDRRRRAGVRKTPNPSLDEAYSLIVRSLGHLSGVAGGGNSRRSVAIATAIDHLYSAEDLLKPYRAGYDDTGRKAA